MSTEFGKRVKAARLRANMTQQQLAAAAGIRQPTIHKIENEAHSSKYSTQIAMACGVSAEWLATGEGEMLVTDRREAVASGTTLSLHAAYIRARRIPVRGAALILPNDTYEEVSMTLEASEREVEAYSNDVEAYALRVKGDGLFPTIRDGWLLVIEPSARPVPGQFVLMTMADGTRLVKELIIVKAHAVTVMPVNGGERQTIALSDLAPNRGLQPIASLLSPTERRPG